MACNPLPEQSATILNNYAPLAVSAINSQEPSAALTISQEPLAASAINSQEPSAAITKRMNLSRDGCGEYREMTLTNVSRRLQVLCDWRCSYSLAK